MIDYIKCLKKIKYDKRISSDVLKSVNNAFQNIQNKLKNNRIGEDDIRNEIVSILRDVHLLNLENNKKSLKGGEFKIVWYEKNKEIIFY